MNVVVASQRHFIEPPVLGNCQDPSCQTMANVLGDEVTITTQDELRRYVGKGLLLVATYYPGGLRRGRDGRATNGIRVCAACDERALRVWLDDQA